MPESNNTVKLKSTPVLLDRAIQGLQQTLLANLPWLDKAYGRGYKMVQHLDNGTKYVYPAAYIGGSEYASLTPNDNIGNFCWFDIYDPQVITAQIPAFPTHTYKGALVFWLNLQTVYQTDEFINSEEIKSEILSIITTPGAIASGIGRVSVTEVVEGIDSIYKGYTLEHVYSMRNYAEEDLQSLDKQFFMFPYYGVRFEFEITIRETCPTKKAIASTPIIKEVTLDKNGEYFITADKEGLLLKGVRTEVKVPQPNIEPTKQVTFNDNITMTITPSEGYDAMREVEVEVIVPTTALATLDKTIFENGEFEFLPNDGEAFDKVKIKINVTMDIIDNLLSNRTDASLSANQGRILNNKKAEKIVVVNQTETTLEIQPNVLNVWGEVATLDITLATPTDTSIVNEYMVQFTSGATPTQLVLPDTIEWMSEPTINANATYQVSIINNLAVIGEWSNE